MNFNKIIRDLEALKNRHNINGMARFGIKAKNILGIPKPKLDEMTRTNGKNHALALRLWDSKIHEARILAALIDIPADVLRELKSCKIRN